MNPIHSNLSTTTITVFIGQQQQLLKLLQAARMVNLNKVKTRISISRFVKIKLGNTFRFVIYHNQRHILQAKRVLVN